MVVLVTSSKLPVRPQSRGGLGEWPAPYPHRSADLCDPTAMTRHVARPQVVRGARLLSGGLRQTFFLAEHKLLLGISSERISQISIRDPQSSCAENASAQVCTSITHSGRVKPLYNCWRSHRYNHLCPILGKFDFGKVCDASFKFWSCSVFIWLHS